MIKILLIYISLFFVAFTVLIGCSDGGGNTPNIEEEAKIFSLEVDINGTEVTGMISGSEILFEIPFLNNRIPKAGRVDVLALSPGATSSAIKVGSDISFINAVAHVVITNGSKSTTYRLKLINSLSILYAFKFTRLDNPNLPADIEGVIGDNNEITFPPTSSTIDITSLKANFTSSIGADVKVKNMVQTSSNTVNSFLSPNSYSVIAQNGTSISVYTVNPIPQYIDVIDPNFRTILSFRYPSAFDSKGVIDPTSKSVTSVTTMDVSSQNIASLSGIECFINLTSLICSDNKITDLDLSSNPNIKILKCDSNQLSSITFGNAEIITTLNCSNNLLTSLDLNLLVNLESLKFANNQISSISTFLSPKIKTLEFSGNVIHSLDLSANINLETLDCSNNSLSELRLPANIALSTLSCSNNLIQSLDLSLHNQLTSLDCTGNTLTNLDISAMRIVNLLKIISTDSDNPLTQLRIHKSIENNAEIEKIKTDRPNTNITVIQ